MEITRTNFRAQLPHLKRVIDAAQFFAIDTEFTGLNFGDSITPFDTPADYYSKISENTAGYIIVQFGITAFTVVDGPPQTSAAAADGAGAEAPPPHFRYESFNFYVTPRARTQTFRCQGESLAFLGSHNFDFNKLFRDGISYCDIIEANELRHKMGERTAAGEAAANAYAGQASLQVPKEEQEMLGQIRESVRQFLASDEKEITIEHCNAFRRKLVYQLLEGEFADQVFASPRKIPNSSIKVIVIQRKKSSAEERQYYADKLEQEWAELEDFIGFTAVLKLLSESKKLIVGHNMFLDVLYSVRQFFAPDMPTLNDFKRVTHKMFPALLDTKYLCAQDCLRSKIPSSALGDIFECMKKRPFVMPELQPVESGHSYANIDGQMHDAGYDSYMTGVSFIAMSQHLNIAANQLHGQSNKLKNLVNKLYILRLADICYIDLKGKEPQPNRDHVFHVTVPDGWKHPQIIKQFRNYGNVISSWLSANECFVALQQREHSKVVLPTIRLCEGVAIATFADYQARRQLGQLTLTAASSSSTPAPTTTNARDSCSKLPTKRRNNGDSAATPTTTITASTSSNEAATATTTADGNDATDDATDCNKEQNLTKKPKLKPPRTEQKTVFAVNDDWATEQT